MIDETMKLRTYFLLIACCVASFSTCKNLLASDYCIRTQCRGEKRLSSELAFVQQAHSTYKGICRDGRAVYDVPDADVNTMRSLASQIQQNVPEIRERSNRLLISYPDLTHKPSVETMKAAHLKVVQDYENGSFLIVEPEDGVSSSTIAALMSDNSVAYVAPDYIMSIPGKEDDQVPGPTVTESSPNDPFLDRLWGMQNCGAIKVWPRHHEAKKIVVAVIDSGVDYRHPDLLGNMWSRNGSYGYDFYDDDNDPLDEQDHGTHVAGTIAGIGHNQVGVVGVAWEAQIMAMRFLGPDGSGATSDAVKCIDWAVANGAHILNNSWGGPDSSPELVEAVARAERRGVLFVAAAGNTGGTGNNNDLRPSYPSSLLSRNVISVGAIDENDARGSFSHYGKNSVDIGAPGVQVLSTTRNNGYNAFSGTSMAAPHVAGAAALIWAAEFPNPTQNPEQMVKVRDLIYKNARPVVGLREFWGHNAPAQVPGGVLDLSFLLNSDLPSEPIPPIDTLRRRLVENRMIVDPERLR